MNSRHEWPPPKRRRLADEQDTVFSRAENEVLPPISQHSADHQDAHGPGFLPPLAHLHPPSSFPPLKWPSAQTASLQCTVRSEPLFSRAGSYSNASSGQERHNSPYPATCIQPQTTSQASAQYHGFVQQTPVAILPKLHHDHLQATNSIQTPHFLSTATTEDVPFVCHDVAVPMMHTRVSSLTQSVHDVVSSAGLLNASQVSDLEGMDRRKEVVCFGMV